MAQYGEVDLIKTIDVGVILTGADPHLLKGLKMQTKSTPVWDCNVQHALMLIGYLTAPPAKASFHLPWAWMRYATAIDPSSPALQLQPDWTAVNPHQKTILADDFGMGFTCHYLLEHFGFEAFADTNHVLDAVFPGTAGLKRVAANGAAKSPDFLAIDSQNRIHILECKGSQRSQRSVAEAMDAGVAQKNNVKYGSKFASCMVGGLYVPLTGSASKALLRYQDPEPDPRLELLDEKGLDSLRKAIRRISFAKLLVSIGLQRAADALMSGDVAEEDRDFLTQLETGELPFVEFQETAEGRWERTIERRSYQPRRSDANEASDHKLGSRGYEPIKVSFTISIPRTIPALFRSVFRNGRITSARLDALDELLEIEVNRGRGLNGRQREIAPSAWRLSESSDLTSRITSPEGVRLTMSTEPYLP